MIAPLTRLRELLTKNKTDAVLISSISNIIYLTNYSGFSKEEREAYLLITRTHQYILTDGRYAEAVKTLIPDFKLVEISSKNSVNKILQDLKKKHKIKKLGFEGHNISFLEHKNLLPYFNNVNHFSMNSLRTVKDIHEILAIEKACKLGDKTFNYILKKIKFGVSEKELANEIEFFIKKNGADISFKPIVAFGKNSAIPHHQTTNNQLTSNQIILLDFGVKLNNYCSDMTRTIFFGKATPEFKKMYKTVLSAQKLAIEQLNNLTMKHSKKQMKASEIDKTAREYIISRGYKTIPHSLGHGIGIEVHEAPHLSPNSKNVLTEGMVFSVEPGIYLSADLSAEVPAKGEASAKEGIPNFGGVRIEDLVVLEKNNLPRRKAGLRLLTHSPKTIIEL